MPSFLGSAELTCYICGQADRSCRPVLANFAFLPQLDIECYSAIFIGTNCSYYTRLHGRARLSEMDSVMK